MIKYAQTYSVAHVNKRAGREREISPSPQLLSKPKRGRNNETQSRSAFPSPLTTPLQLNLAKKRAVGESNPMSARQVINSHPLVPSSTTAQTLQSQDVCPQNITSWGLLFFTPNPLLLILGLFSQKNQLYFSSPYQSIKALGKTFKTLLSRCSQPNNSIILYICQLPRKCNYKPVTTIALIANQTWFYQYDCMIPTTKELEHWNRIESYQKLYKVLRNSQIWRFRDVFQNISKSFFSRLNSSYIYYWVTRNIFPNSREYYLPYILSAIGHKVLSGSYPLCLCKTFRNRNLAGFVLRRFTKPFMFNYSVNMEIIIALSTFNFYAPETPKKPMLNITPISKSYEIPDEVLHYVFI